MEVLDQAGVLACVGLQHMGFHQLHHLILRVRADAGQCLAIGQIGGQNYYDNITQIGNYRYSNGSLGNTNYNSTGYGIGNTYYTNSRYSPRW